MLLAIDVGNTNTVFAVFKDRELVGTWRLSSENERTSEEYALALSKLMELDKLEFSDISGVIISNVVPQTAFPLKNFCRRYFNIEPLVVGEKSVILNVDVKLERPIEVGADRLVNAVAAYKLYKKAVVIIDFGTATTFDVIDSKGAYLGGVISPGVNLSIEALHRAAAKLPEVAVEKPTKVIGNNTITAMQSGVYWGYVSMIEGIIARIKEEFGGEVTTVATGGLAPLFAKATQVIDELECDLTIRGLLEIYESNTQ
jgi:type III pantothenate kinase